MKASRTSVFSSVLVVLRDFAGGFADFVSRGEEVAIVGVSDVWVVGLSCCFRSFMGSNVGGELNPGKGARRPLQYSCIARLWGEISGI